MINIVIPMAGAGSRFSRKGYAQPKPLIPINGIPMIRVVINNLMPKRRHRFIFICQQTHIADYGLADKLPQWAPGCEIIGLDGITDGAACTVLAARNLINSDDELMIANSDQYVDISIDHYLERMRTEDSDGIIMTMHANDPKWSFVGLDAKKHVTHVVEKQVISDEATVGIYNFKHGRDFVSGADKMIEQNLRVNGEFYVAPVYNELIKRGHNITVHNIGKEFDGMYGLGIPEDLDLFLSLPIHLKATQVTV